MDRREFLRGAGQMLLVLPFGTFLVRCSSNDEGGAISSTSPTEPGGSPPAAPPRVEGANVVYTSSETNAHSHGFSLPSDLSSPPAAGISGATTSAQLHSHLVLVSAAGLRDVADGKSVRVETTTVEGHTHTFTFVRIG